MARNGKPLHQVIADALPETRAAGQSEISYAETDTDHARESPRMREHWIDSREQNGSEASLHPAPESSQSWETLAQECCYCRRRLARLLHVSVRTLDRYFQKHLQINCRTWLREVQLVSAWARLLAGRPVKEVSYHLGFKQPSHFTRLFKARFGIPPSRVAPARDIFSKRIGLGHPLPLRAFSPSPGSIPQEARL